ncbi:hypothetical protein [Halorubrum laminariae]|uniref:Cox cluster protein n=1 Tax=Halorubrum laminariae TaxID=1433523 RepID=A0ABD6BZN2_9EURY|nr:hypothetical protein [Halorubrum laminariae]
MTDDADSGRRIDADGDAAAVDEGAVDDTANEVGADHPEAVAFGDLSLPQRIFVAAVQNPARGVAIVGLLAFAFSFYVAFWLAFPRIAALASVVGAVLVAIVAGVYIVSDRLSE